MLLHNRRPGAEKCCRSRTDLPRAPIRPGRGSSAGRPHPTSAQVLDGARPYPTRARVLGGSRLYPTRAQVLDGSRPYPTRAQVLGGSRPYPTRAQVLGFACGRALVG